MNSIARWLTSLGTTAGLSLLGISCASSGETVRANEEDSRYRFADVTVMPVDESTARISWSTRWEGETFPGVRSCRWIVTGESGEVVGEGSDTFVSMDSVGEEMATDVDVAGDAASATIECDGLRLDAGSPYAYEFSDVRPIPLGTDDGSWGIEYEAAWRATGHAGPVTCTAAILGKDGADIQSREVTIFIADGETHNGVVIMGPDPGDARPESAGLTSCRPFA